MLSIMKNWYIIKYSFYYVSKCLVFDQKTKNYVLELFGRSFCIVGMFCIINWYFECVYRILCCFLYIWTHFKDEFLHFVGQCPRSVNNSRTKYLFVSCCDFGGPKWRPHHPHPQRQCQSFLSGGNKYWEE